MTIKNLSEFIKLFEELLRHRGIINNDNSLKERYDKTNRQTNL